MLLLTITHNCHPGFIPGPAFDIKTKLLVLVFFPNADEALVLAEGKPEGGPDEDEVADEASPSFCLVVGIAVFKFKAAAGDAEVVPQRPGERDDEAHEHPENGE